MTEVRSALDGQQNGIFATRRFEEGQEIFRETSPWKLLFDDDNTASKILARFKKGSMAKESKEVNKLICILSAMLKYDKTSESDRQWLLELYHPRSNTDTNHNTTTTPELDRMVDRTLEWLNHQEDWNTDHANDLESLRNIAMVWAHNAFAGGRIYPLHSRLNHSCHPNAIVQTDPTNSDTQWIRALHPIEADEEITISYLPIEFLYSETQFRRDVLQNTKYFVCQCPRCSNPEEPVTSMPCIKCHARQGILEEDVQYDDEQTVKYAWVVSLPQQQYKCSCCEQTFSNASNDSDRALRTHKAVTDKISAFLQTYQHDKQDDDTLLEYTSLSSSVNGALHWTTNILLYYQLDSTLQDYHKRLLQDTNNQEPDMDQIAEFIDTLQRLCRFVQHSKLDLHRGHWLGDVIIGTARALVALGDVKSQKYAAEWLTENDFDAFVQRFEPTHLRTVVDRLRMAWSHNDSADDTMNCDSGNKRMKKEA